MADNRFGAYKSHFERMGNRPASEQVDEYALLKASHHYERWLPADKSVKTLDIGCGLGHQLLTLSKLGYTELTGIELVPELCEITSGDLDGVATVVNADAFEWLPEHRDRFGLIVCFDVLEHVQRENASEFVKLIYDALEPGGTAVFRVPNMSSLLGGYYMHLDFTHVTGYTEYSLMQLLEQAGFVDQKVENARVLVNFKRWRPWAPWRGAREAVNWLLHMAVYLTNGTGPRRPTVFECNILMSTRKPG